MKSLSQVKKLIVIAASAVAVCLTVIECCDCAYIIGGKVQAKIQVEGGIAELEKADYVSAINKFTEVIERDPYNVEAYCGAASAYIGLEDYDSALKVLLSADKLFEALGQSKDALVSRRELNARIEQVKECKMRDNALDEL